MKHHFLAYISISLPSALIIWAQALLPIKPVLINSLNKTDKAAVERAQKAYVLERFFEKFNSPLRGHAKDFVATAEKYDLDYKLLPAISCMESSCGKFLIPSTYNPFGWGIYGNYVTYFDSYAEAIDIVGRGLSQNYIKKGLNTVERIAPVYTPPRHVHWKTGVNYFVGKMNEIEGKSTLTI